MRLNMKAVIIGSVGAIIVMGMKNENVRDDVNKLWDTVKQEVTEGIESIKDEVEDYIDAIKSVRNSKKENEEI